AALLSAGLDSLEALVSHTATGKGMASRWILATRGWRRTDWGAAVERPRERGVLDREGALTGTGTARRAELEEAAGA
ncbi:helix-turn-helix domain-containing protein, partial [Streptomyces sp. JAC25]|uniref:helix-turn-helix domain-containing protein n=1 Tax=Streptomyces sp. JAC25 TaxID=3418413 RepID=UPI003D812CB5